MSNLKKTLALVLALVMCFGVLAIGASAAYTDDAEITYYEAVQVLTELGVMNGEKNDNGSYTLRPKDNITRAEFCKLLCVVMNGGKDPVLGEVSKFTFDDTKGHWAAAYIEFLAGLGIVAGYDAHTFGPEDPITAQQAAKMLLVAQGYDAAYEQMVGTQWGARADALANLKTWGTDLYAELPSNFVTTSLLKREEAAQMIYNAFGRQMIYYRSAGEHGVVGVQAVGSTNFFVFYFNAVPVDGVVYKNEFGHVISEAGYDLDTTNIRVFTEAGLNRTPIKLNKQSPAEYLGMAVRSAYYVTTRAGVTKNIVIGGISLSEYNKTTVIDKAGLYTKVEAGMQIEDAVLLYNYNNTWSNYVLEKTEFLGNGMKATAIDNNDDGKAEFVQIVATHPYEVKSVDAKTGEVVLYDIYGDYNCCDYDDLSKGGDYTRIKKGDFFYADDATAATVKKGDIILASVYGGRVWLADYTTFTGEIDRISEKTVKSGDFSWDEYKLTIDGKAYGIHDGSVYPYGNYFGRDGFEWADDNALFNVGMELKFYADAEGFVFYAEKISSTYFYPEFALAVESDPIAQYPNSQPVTLVFGDGSVEKVQVSEIYNDTDCKWEKVSYARSVWLDLSDNGGIYEGINMALVAYAVKADGTYMIMPYNPEGDGNSKYAVNKVDTDEFIALKKGDTRIFNDADTLNNTTAVSSIYTDSQTDFVDVAKKPIAYKGYANVPNWNLTDATIFAANDEMAYDAFEAFNDGVNRDDSEVGGKAYNSRLITDMFVTDGKYEFDANAAISYFYIPDFDDVDFATIDGLRVVTFNNAVVNGVPGQKLTIARYIDKARDAYTNANIAWDGEYDPNPTAANATDIVPKTLYKVTAANSDEVVLAVLRGADAANKLSQTLTFPIALNNVAGSVATPDDGVLYVDYSNNTTLSVDENDDHTDGVLGSYTITNAKIVNVKTDKAIKGDDIKFDQGKTTPGSAGGAPVDKDDIVIVIEDTKNPNVAAQVYVIPYNYQIINWSSL